jgi:hypothetical protein
MTAALGLLAFSGCVSDDDGEDLGDGTGNEPAGPAQFTEDTGAIEGSIIDDQALPVAGVEVVIQELERSTRTDESGRFVFNNVEPGAYTILFSKLGFEAKGQTVNVAAGQATAVEVMLDPIAVDTPYHQTIIQEGRVGCGVRFYPGAPLVGVGDPGWYTGVAVCGVYPVFPDQFLLTWDLPATATEINVDMEWQSNQALGRGLSVVLEHNGHANDADYTFGGDVGESPLMVYADTDKMLAVENTSGISCFDDGCPLYSRVFASANTTNLDWPTEPPTVPVFGQMHKRLLDAGIVQDQPFTQYLTHFHLMTKPDGFTALPGA